MRDLVDTTEMYLRTIYELEEEGITPLRARIAERLEQSGPTVSQTVARMERDGLLHVRPDRSLDLTARGRELATKVMRKHRLAELLLTEVLGVDIHDVHEEACRWEHVMSDNVERRVTAGIVVGAKVNVINYGHSVILTADNGAKVVLNETLGHAVRIATD